MTAIIRLSYLIFKQTNKEAGNQNKQTKQEAEVESDSRVVLRDHFQEALPSLIKNTHHHDHHHHHHHRFHHDHHHHCIPHHIPHHDQHDICVQDN